MNLPFDVMEIIVSKMTFQDVLTYPNVENIRQVILLCPEEWHTQLLEYVKYVRDVSNVKINASQVNSYLIMEEIEVRNNASLITEPSKSKIFGKETLFSLQKLCDGLLEKYETTYNWRVKQFHFLLNDDVNWNIDNIKTILHEILLFYCNRLGFNKTNIVQKINLLTPYIKGLVCHTSNIDMQKSVFQFVTNNLYDGNAELLYIFITQGEKQVPISIWNGYLEHILDHVEEELDLKDRLINIGTSMNWNVDYIKSIANICTEHNLIITTDFHDLIVQGITGEITIIKVEKLLLEDKHDTYESLCDEKLLSSGISPEHYSDLFSWECFDKFYQNNAIDQFVNTVKDIYKIKNVIAKNGIEMEDGRLYKNDISIDEYVSYVVWYKVIDDCISLNNDSNTNIDVYDIIAFIHGLFKRLFQLKKALNRKGLSLENSEICRDYIENGEGNIKSIVQLIQKSMT
jgi:hypothetical protein